MKKAVKAGKNFYRNRATELAQTVLKLEAHVTLLEQKLDMANQRTEQAERDLVAVTERWSSDRVAWAILGVVVGLAAGSLMALLIRELLWRTL